MYHLHFECVTKGCKLLCFECSVHVSDGFPKKTLLDRRVGEWVKSINFVYGFFGNFLTLQSPLCADLHKEDRGHK